MNPPLWPRLFKLAGACLGMAWVASASWASADRTTTPSGITPDTLAVIVNDADPQSREVAVYYQKQRRIPPANMIHVRFPAGASVMSRDLFQKVYATVQAHTPPPVQAYALTWTVPYRVECMSITTAFATGFDPQYCANGCGPTKPSPYFNSDSRAPYADHDLRPTMTLAGKNVEEVKKLIDRGVAADGTHPTGTGYLLDTKDSARNVRASLYPTLVQYLADKISLQVVHADFIENRDDVMFYFTGVTSVRGLDRVRFRPGALADHLTSAGGQLIDSPQMSILRWLEAGATGSYGAVVEPCNFPGKFPSPGVAIRHYLRGESLIEAYWKSVAMPGQGIFVGEPLAAPYRGRSDNGAAKP